MDDISKRLDTKFKEILADFEAQLKTIHTGKAHSGLVEEIKVNQYNNLLPLKQLATISISSPQEIMVRPWDAGTLQPIETALRESGRNLQVISDGSIVRIILPPMSGERRQELLKLVSRQAEAAKVALRSFREHIWQDIKNMEKHGQITQDDRYRFEEEINRLIAEYNKKIEGLVLQKQASIEF